MNQNDKIFVAGHRGMVGAATIKALVREGYDNQIVRARSELDLRDATATSAFFEKEKPAVVILAAAKVGGIHANNIYPAEFMYDNLSIALNVIHAAYRSQVSRLLFLGSSCIYPTNIPQPMAEEALLSAHLEKTNEAYAIAKIAGLKLCEYYRKQFAVTFHSVMPANLYGPGDNYHPDNSHVLPALIRRFHEARENQLPEVTLWGTGSPKREFLHVNDLADAILHLLRLDNPPDLLNAGIGADLTILELAQIVKRVVGYEGELKQDPSKPDGTPQKLLDSSKIQATGWKAKIPLEEGIKQTYQSFLQDKEAGTLRL